ncbi:Putative glycoside hydrolase superfamily [Septoria linicola]|uniref:Glycoside hydrolase superfamily n=1 Tax=Septoria linicola TaxID=215465 RepID=A0A9Q9AUX9_9PEZI|nr:putative glycoside hydrolase superfamily [Septoria linicola]USW55879.1 Putative glycoside hydrolase superfamily [Septoria linicola]
MSAIKFSIVALASSAIASRHGHPYGAHKHLHSSGTGAAYATGSAGPYPYPNANGTGVWGSTGISKPSAPAGYDSASSGSPDQYSTLYSTSYQTVTVEQNYKAPAASGTGAAPAGYGSSASVADAASGSQCAAVTVTYTEKVTATITEGQNVPSKTDASPVESSSAASVPGYSAPAYGSSSSSEASPAKSSAPSAPAYSAPSSSSTEAAPVTTSAPSYESASPSASLTLSAYGANKQVENGANSASAYSSASSTKSAAPSYSSSSSSSGGKRGLAYNDASLTTCFSGSREVSWAYNWGSSSGGLTGDYTFIPTLWGTGSDFVNSWDNNAKSAISSGSSHLFSFNEPDHTEQANLSPAAAATAYAKYMNPYKGQAQLCAPSVTNGGGDMGLTWLKSFLDACTDCQIDCLNIHWYDSAENTEYFKSHIEDAAKLAPGKPIYVSEFGATGSDDQVNSFLQEVMPWMDSNSDVAGYAYFMVENGKLVSGTEPSTYGSTYMSYTS